jgi:hypothetical protein
MISIRWLQKMKWGKYDYMVKFKEQVDKFEQYEAMFFKLYTTTQSEFIKLKCIEDMFKTNIALVNMYHLLPQIVQNVPLDMINNSNNKIDYYNDMDLSVY